VEVIILDVSSGGFRLEVSEHLRIGEHVTLRVEHCEEFPAQIRWALGDEAGGVFLAPADYEAIGAGGPTMTERGSNRDQDRRQSERREGERREVGERRTGSRKHDRRQTDRREGDRRS
jgi:hypothetical protein